MQVQAPSPGEERPPPPPPKEWRAASLPATRELSVPPKTPTPAPGPPRLKKKVPWKGKNILVLLPWDDERGMRGKAPKPMSESDVQAMMKEWEQLGYDTTGFNLGPEDYESHEGGRGQSRSPWPYVKDVVSERAQRNFRISIPDRREWDAYVQELSEAKLRALGVSFGDEDPVPSISPALPNLSRRTSIMQYPPLPFSPPLPTSSANSSRHGRNQSTFSPNLMIGSTSQSSNQGSVASPISMHPHHLQGKYNARQSVSYSSSEHPFGSPFQYPQQNSPGVWSPQQMMYQQGHARGGSPSLGNLGAIMTPTSPFSQDGYFPPSGDTMNQLHNRQQYLQNQLQMQHGARASPRLQELRETDEEGVSIPSKSPSKTPDAGQFRANPASLQKEIDDAEYHLEGQIQRQLEHDDYSPHSDEAKDQFDPNPVPGHTRNTSSFAKGMAASRYANDSDEGPVLHHPQPHSRGHSLSQRPFHDSEESASDSKPELLSGINNAFKADLSDIETNPSNLGTPVPDESGNDHNRALSIVSNPWADSDQHHTEDDKAPRRGHASKPSMSTLNVAAKEFKFNPANAFKPSNFTFGGNNFQPPIGAYSAFAPPVPPSATGSHFSHGSIASSKGKINVAAPAFSPGNAEFSFSSSGPTFRPDAPAFTPLGSTFSGSIGSGGSGSEGPRTSIFGNIDLSVLGISKPSKKSKAIPIVRPDSSHSQEDGYMEGKDGRITQGEGRIKRARGAKDDGDSVPLFAEPTMPLGETTREQSPPKEAVTLLEKVDKENSAPVDDSGEDAPEVPPKSHARTLSQEAEEKKDFEPFEFSQKKQAEDFNAARPFTSRRYGSGLPAYGNYTPSEDEQHMEDEEPAKEPVKPKGHGRSGSSLSAAAKPFEFRPGSFTFKFGQPSEPEPAPAPVQELVSPPLPPPKNAGLGASRYARSPTPPTKSISPEVEMEPHETSQFQAALPPASPSVHSEELSEDKAPHEQTFEEIDEMMRHLTEVEQKAAPVHDEPPVWLQPSPQRQIAMPNLDQSSPIRLQPQNIMRSDAPSPSPGRFHPMPGQTNVFARVREDPFRGDSPQPGYSSPVHHLNRMDSLPPSEWDDVLSETEEAKLAPRARFFDSHVNELIDGLLSDRLDPVEKALETIQMSLEALAMRGPPSRRDRRSISGALSDADDEDDEEPRRSLSPQRRDKKLEKIRAVVMDALTTHQASRPQTATSIPPAIPDTANLMQVLEEMKEQFGSTMRLDLRGEDLRNIVEEALERRIPVPTEPVIDQVAVARETEQKARIAELEEKLLRAGETSAERLSALEEKLSKTLEDALARRESGTSTPSTSLVDEEAKTREVEFKARISDLEEKLTRMVGDHSSRLAEFEEKLNRSEISKEEEIANRRAAEDRLAEVQRLLRISSEEEDRLREAMDEREVKIREIVDASDLKVRNAEDHRGKIAMNIALLEATQDNAQKAQAELQNRLEISELELRESRQDVQRWQIEAERAMEAAKRHNDDAEVANETNKELRRTIESLRTQMEESIQVREGMRGKLISLQEDMAQAARNISDENSRRAKKEQELIARQEVLDARLQAEARTRERLEREIERLEQGEREGMRAVSDCKKLETLLADLRNESHNAQKEAMRYKREFEEARESGLSELQRTRYYMQAEIEAANNQVNVVREDLENQILKLRAENESVKLDADTTRAKNEMMLEEAENSKTQLVEELKRKHSDSLEDLQANHERKLGNAMEDSQRSEQHLLERLSLSAAKTEHLQDRVAHLEDKLEIANQAAAAAATAAKTARSSHPAPAAHKSASRGMELPERISPQALRESIMVLQEQLQERESTIEKLESTLSTMDVDSPMKLTKRDDEISWLRELLSVRKSDLQDIVQALETEQYDPERVRDAAIRLRANLQMEEQERERKLGEGAGLSLGGVAASVAAVASPRVAQAVGPLAAAWGNWRKGRADSVQGEGSTGRNTPSRTMNQSPANQSFLSGLLTPPARDQGRATPPSLTSGPQPSAFGSTGQRFTAAQLAARSQRRNQPTQQPLGKSISRDSLRSGGSSSSRTNNPLLRDSGRDSALGSVRSGERENPLLRQGGLSRGMGMERGMERRDVPSTPPMMRKSAYDADAMQRGEDLDGDFSEEGFYDDDSTVEGVDLEGRQMQAGMMGMSQFR